MEKAPNIPSELLQPLSGETEKQWLARFVKAGLRDFAYDIIVAHRQKLKAKKTAEGYNKLETDAGFGTTGTKTPGEDPDQIED